MLYIRVRVATPDNRGNSCAPSVHAKRRIWLHATPVHTLYTCAGCNPRRWRQPVCAFGTCKATNFGCTPQFVLYIRVRIAPPHPHTDDSSQPVCAEGTLPSIAPDFRAQRVVGGVLRPHTKRAEGTQLYPNVFRIITEIYITFAVRQRN